MFILISTTYHPSMRYMRDALSVVGKVKFVDIVETRLSKEKIDHLGLNLPSRLLSKIYKPRTRKEKALLKIAFPPLTKFWWLCRLITKSSAIIVYQPKTLFGICCCVIGRISRTNVFCYTETSRNLLLQKGIKQILRLILSPYWFTPRNNEFVGELDCHQTTEDAFYLPFCTGDYNPDSSQIDRKPFSDIRPVVIGMVGIFIPEVKNFELLLRTLSRLENPNVELKLCGEATTEEHFNFVKLIRSKLDKINIKYTITVNIPPNEIFKFYQEIDVLVVPGYNEAAAITPVEALSKGCAVVISKGIGTSCYIKNGYNGYVFDPNFETDLHAILMSILDKSVSLEDLSLNAFSSWLKTHRFDHYREYIVSRI